MSLAPGHACPTSVPTSSSRRVKALSLRFLPSLCRARSIVGASEEREQRRACDLALDLLVAYLDPVTAFPRAFARTPDLYQTVRLGWRGETQGFYLHELDAPRYPPREANFESGIPEAIHLQVRGPIWREPLAALERPEGLTSDEAGTGTPERIEVWKT